MHLAVPLPRLTFRPRLWPTLLAAALVPAFVSLGQWQAGKARVKEDAQALLDTRRAGPAVQMPGTPIRDVEPLRLRPVTARGRYETAGQILIDNRVLHDRPGYHVLTPLRLEDSEMRVLVNRGWVPATPDRRDLPRADAPDGTVEVNGTAVIPSRKLFALAPDTAPAGGDAVWQNLDFERYRGLVGFPLQPVVIQMDADSPGGFVREWPRLDDRHERHLSYAYQWYGFALATLGIWLFFALRPRS